MLSPSRRFDLDDVGAHVGHDLRAVRAHHHRGQVDDADPRAAVRRLSHGRLPGCSHREAVPDVVGVPVGNGREHHAAASGRGSRRGARRRPRSIHDGRYTPGVSAMTARAIRPAMRDEHLAGDRTRFVCQPADGRRHQFGPHRRVGRRVEPSAISGHRGGDDDVASSRRAPRPPAPRRWTARSRPPWPRRSWRRRGCRTARRSTTSARCGRSRRRTSAGTPGAPRGRRRAGARRARPRSRRRTCPCSEPAAHVARVVHQHVDAAEVRRARCRRSPDRPRRWRPNRSLATASPPAARSRAPPSCGRASVGAVAGEAAAEVVDDDLRAAATPAAARTRGPGRARRR